MILLMFSSTANIVVQEYQNNTDVANDNLKPSELKEFKHPYFQTFLY